MLKTPITRSQIKLDGNDFAIKLHFHRVLYVGLNRYGENRILIDVQFFQIFLATSGSSHLKIVAVVRGSEKGIRSELEKSVYFGIA